jgi:hypothetical protein
VRFPNQPTIVGIWGFTGDAKSAALLEPGHPKNVLTTLAAVVERIKEIGSGVDDNVSDATEANALDANTLLDTEESESDPKSLVST